MHHSAPAHPLIHAFLLAGKDFSDARYVIVETAEYAEKLVKHLESLQKVFPKKFTHEYRYIASELDALELSHDPHMVGIYSLPLPAYFGISPKTQ